MPSTHHVVVDGSNLATEGRTVPSLAQLDEAVRAYLSEDPEADIVVVVDASFGHRIDPAERGPLEAAELHGELVAPPAGAIGRGDAFVLRIAERTGAVVLSNDSFQEFHEEHPWLFDEGRLVGGKPVPGVGWIFTPRRPVRGPRSRKVRGSKSDSEEDQLSAPRKAAEVAKALKQASKAAEAVRAKASEAKGAKKKPSAAAPDDRGSDKPAKVAKLAKAKQDAKSTSAKSGQDAKAASKATAAKAVKKLAVAKPVSAKEPPRQKAQKEKPSTKSDEPPTKATTAAKSAKGVKKKAKGGRPLDVQSAIDTATQEVMAPANPRPMGDGVAAKPKRRRRAEPPPAVNQPLPFINFVADHPLGSTVEGTVASFTSHGAMVDVALDDGEVLHCYAPLSGLGVPPPRAARDAVQRGERREFRLVALDPPRRMAELALTELASLLAEGPKAAG